MMNDTRFAITYVIGWVLILAVLVSIIVTTSCAKDGAWNTANNQRTTEVPLTISAPDELAAATATATAVWNDAVGCEVFKAVTGNTAGHTADVIVEYASRTKRNPRTGARIDAEAWRGTQSRIVVYTRGTITWNHLILMHEMGHILGLGHDRSWMSVMRPGSHAPRRTGDVDRGPPWPIVSHQDRRLVRRRYCKTIREQR